ncbi:uncharacterized protein LOC125155310 isoform X2 [Prionailurus viverrinus]|uniref:uncharacterized protein LOC125155310 isoform X2 n=1 Tax=Prionailurus viverrinus TaxID=61388 RepID=UPI001FF4AACC|nr:uncharacterized protein LOC125155310 isoform X2 [Prionailurus viverrinus]
MLTAQRRRCGIQVTCSSLADVSTLKCSKLRNTEQIRGKVIAQRIWSRGRCYLSRSECENGWTGAVDRDSGDKRCERPTCALKTTEHCRTNLRKTLQIEDVHHVHRTGVFKRRGRDTRDACTRRKDHVRTHKKVAIDKSKRDASGETTVLAPSSLQNCEKIKKHPCKQERDRLHHLVGVKQQNSVSSILL